jgi:hypothetical protein
MTRNQWLTAVVLGALVSALFWIDPLFVPLALLGPLVVGAVAAAKGLPWLWPAVVVVVAGLGAVISDWIVNQEDVGFHLVLTVVMAFLALGAWAAARTVASRRSRVREVAASTTE